MEENFFTYKGKPIVRKGNTIYYGSTEEKYIIMLEINTEKEIGGTAVADKVTVSLLLSDEDLKMKDRIVKKSEKNGLYAAMDIGSIWLERALKSE